ncbi:MULTISPECIES: hypothetical protein [unclassified Synechococcus]|jgi:hypothetical protein|uniref:hypothetical protein n=1 Tax=unclassified Synechococcus TaxID=2626047 RepID=UPI0020011B72|nr:hypothetical protein [Synechococcus sp. A10-1-5-1]UPM49414.1 hypothetical protein MY494_08685 [Synechococcus sp. A10-1-5-1]
MEILIHLPAVMVAGSAAFIGYSYYSAAVQRAAKRERLRQAAYPNVVGLSSRTLEPERPELEPPRDLDVAA